MVNSMTEPYDFLPEDLGVGDVTSEALLDNENAAAVILAKEDSIMAGLEEAQKIFEHEGLRTTPRARDGASSTVIRKVRFLFITSLPRQEDRRSSPRRSPSKT